MMPNSEKTMEKSSACAKTAALFIPGPKYTAAFPTHGTTAR